MWRVWFLKRQSQLTFTPLETNPESFMVIKPLTSCHSQENLLKADSALLTHGGMERVSKQFNFSSPLSAPCICIPTLLCTHSSTLKLLINVARLKMSFPVATASLSTFSVLAGLQVMISNYLCISCCFSFPPRLMASRKAPSFLVNLGFFKHL